MSNGRASWGARLRRWGRPEAAAKYRLSSGALWSPEAGRVSTHIPIVAYTTVAWKESIARVWMDRRPPHCCPPGRRFGRGAGRGGPGRVHRIFGRRDSWPVGRLASRPVFWPSRGDGSDPPAPGTGSGGGWHFLSWRPRPFGVASAVRKERNGKQLRAPEGKPRGRRRVGSGGRLGGDGSPAKERGRDGGGAAGAGEAGAAISVGRCSATGAR